MKYKIQYVDGCPDLVRVHVDERLIRGKALDANDLHYEKERFRKRAANPEGLIGCLKTLRALPGVEDEFSVTCYSIQLTKARLFKWKDLMPSILHALHFFLAPEGGLEEASLSKGKIRQPHGASVEKGTMQKDG